MVERERKSGGERMRRRVVLGGRGGRVLRHL